MDIDTLREKVYSPEQLPNGMIGLETDMGRSLLEKSTIKDMKIVGNGVKQISMTACGPISSMVLINATGAAERVRELSSKENVNIGLDSLSLKEEEFMKLPCLLEYFKSVDIDKNGLTLSQLHQVCTLLGFNASAIHALKGPNTDLDTSPIKLPGQNYGDDDQDIVINEFINVNEFRKFIMTQINKPSTGLIANYNMSILGYGGLRGHFSPIAAYDQERDMCLIMDTWPNTPSAWVKISNLYEAMCDEDSQSELPRGLLCVRSGTF